MISLSRALYLISEKSIWKNQVRRTWFLLLVQPAKINFEIVFCRLKIQCVEIDFYNLIFQKSSTGQLAVKLVGSQNNLFLRPIIWMGPFWLKSLGGHALLAPFKVHWWFSKTILVLASKLLGALTNGIIIWFGLMPCPSIGPNWFWIVQIVLI